MKRNLATALFFVLSLATTDAFCDQYLTVGGWSRHWIEGTFNETHKMIGYQNDDYFFTRFKNSEDRTAFAVGFSETLLKNNIIVLRGYYGASTGYEYFELFPTVAAGIEFNTGTIVSPELNIMPAAAVITFKIKID